MGWTFINETLFASTVYSRKKRTNQLQSNVARYGLIGFIARIQKDSASPPAPAHFIFHSSSIMLTPFGSQYIYIFFIQGKQLVPFLEKSEWNNTQVLPVNMLQAANIVTIWIAENITNKIFPTPCLPEFSMILQNCT